jgi:hypothetical protein
VVVEVDVSAVANVDTVVNVETANPLNSTIEETLENNDI